MQYPSGFGQLDTSGQALQQGGTECFLKRLNALGHSGLREIERLRGACKRALLNNGVEQHQVLQVKHYDMESKI
ncbi:MAG: hypothetical protein D6758_10170 [Gammaproteobacteria bacterium]|nr:MAG: hypothetical protein D6758_10170 [Gammaproteobacteria bacterium]